MGEDRSIPDHVNDNVPVDEIDRRERFEAALLTLAGFLDDRPVNDDARRMAGINSNKSVDAMKRHAFISAAINNVPAIIKKLAPSYPDIVDLQALVDRVRLEVVIRRLD